MGKDARVAIIAPYADLKAESVAAVEELGIDVIVEEGDLAEGVRAARRAVESGAEVIISRGGTALRIARELNVPVVEIQVSPYDILRCLYQLREYRGLIGITGFRNVVYGCEILGDLLGMRIRHYIVESEEDALGKITDAARSGVGMIIGDAVSVKLASRLGIEGMLVASGKEAVAKAIEEAQKVAEVRVRERERSRKELEERENLKERLFQSQKMETVGLLAGGVAHDFNNLLTPILGYSEMMMTGLPEGNPDRKKLEQIHQAADMARVLTMRLLAFGRKQMLRLDVLDMGTIVRGLEPVIRRTIREDIRIETVVGGEPGLVRADKGQIEQALLN
ncbi:MAG: PrpR N-terminal domain-containing protein, partial [Deltaproteobacteria bacterium]|nr:PrpR N-terminal domain-containing protein [Deltaproteobacteria bacterium]